mgnify:CR=1 FL=1
MQQLQTGTLLQGDKYKIEKILGQGGFGITYLANQELLDRKVCIKEFFFKEYCERDEATSHVTLGTQSSRETVERFMAKFLKEARTISKLEHPNIIRIHDIFMENNTAYYVMDYIDGESLSEMVKRRGALPEGEAVEYIKQVASALDFIHQRSINHLDIKPANIMVCQSDQRTILIDFGLSKQYDEQGGQTSTTPVGISHGYAPMEQYKQGGVNTFSPQTDIYSLGATLYKLVTGNTPPQAMDLIDEGLPSLPPTLSASVVETIKKAMQFRKVDRPSSISEFLKILNSTPQQTPSFKQTCTPEYSKVNSEETIVLIGKDNRQAEQGLVRPHYHHNDVKATIVQPSLSSQTISGNNEKKIGTEKFPYCSKTIFYLICIAFFVDLVWIVDWNYSGWLYSLGLGDKWFGYIFVTIATIVCSFLLSRKLRAYNKVNNKIQNPIISFLLASFYTLCLFCTECIHWRFCYYYDHNYCWIQDYKFMLLVHCTSIILIPLGIAQILLWDKKGVISIFIGLGLLLLPLDYYVPHFWIYVCLFCMFMLLSIKQSGVNTWCQLDFKIPISKHKLLYLFFIIERIVTFILFTNLYGNYFG